MEIPFIERVKIQAEVLVPLVKLLEAELGETRARELARKGLGNWARELGRSIGAAPAGTSVQKIAAVLPMFAAGGALEVDVLRQDANAFAFNVTGCRYARFYQEMGAAELGFVPRTRESGAVIYFGHGSNLNPAALRAKGVDPLHSEPAVLRRWRLEFSVTPPFPSQGAMRGRPRRGRGRPTGASS